MATDGRGAGGRGLSTKGGGGVRRASRGGRSPIAATTTTTGQRGSTTQMSSAPATASRREAEGDETGRVLEGSAEHKTWSKPMTFRQAAEMAPVMIELDEGERGAEESLCFSAGDCLALEGVVNVKGRPVLMAHYATELETDQEDRYQEGEEDVEIYRALVTLPWDSLPDIEVRVLKDPGHKTYAKFLTTHFPDRNWGHHQQEILEDVVEYKNIGPRLVLPVTPHPQVRSGSDSHPVPSDKDWALTEQPPPLPVPRLRAALPARDGGGRKKKEEIEEESTPPPRPPKSSTLKAKIASTSSNRAGHPLFQLHSSAHVTPVSPNWATWSNDQDRSQDNPPFTGFSMPSIADVFTSGPFSEKDFQAALSTKKGRQSDELGTEYEAEDKKQASPLHRAKSFGKKVCTNLGQLGAKIAINSIAQASSKPTTTTTTTNITTTKTTTTTNITATAYLTAVTNDSDTDDDDDCYEELLDYDELDVNTMIPEFDHRGPQRPPRGWNTANSHPGNGQKAAVNNAVVKPVMMVQPTRTKTPTTGELTSETKDDQSKPVTSPLAKMNCYQLSAHLRDCGMANLASICLARSLNGIAFCAISNDTLRKPPFSLSDFDVNAKLVMIKEGWVPK